MGRGQTDRRTDELENLRVITRVVGNCRSKLRKVPDSLAAEYYETVLTAGSFPGARSSFWVKFNGPRWAT